MCSYLFHLVLIILQDGSIWNSARSRSEQSDVHRNCTISRDVFSQILGSYESWSSTVMSAPSAVDWASKSPHSYQKVGMIFLLYKSHDALMENVTNCKAENPRSWAEPRQLSLSSTNATPSFFYFYFTFSDEIEKNPLDHLPKEKKWRGFNQPK